MDMGQPARKGLHNPEESTEHSTSPSPLPPRKTDKSLRLIIIIRPGCVLLQQEEKHWRPVIYASRSLSETEQRYTHVEKEALAVTWACEKFQDFLVGLPQFCIETDHKPLLALLKTKQLDELTSRIQRFRMRLMCFSYEIVHTAGKNLMTVDTLSRAPGSVPAEQERLMEVETHNHVCSVLGAIPASDARLEQIRQKQLDGKICSQVITFCKLDHWPERAKKDEELRAYWLVRQDLSVQMGLLLYQCRLVIPASLQEDILQRLHQGHQGIVKCRALARESVWWPGLSKRMEKVVEACPTCEKDRQYPPEPMRPTKTPDYPWQRIGMDLFQLNGQQYLLMVDYYSRWIEIAHLRQTTAAAVIEHTKSIFARHGIPEIVVSDNGPQFSSAGFLKFAMNYNFTHITSSPHHPQGNGEAERAVQTTKNLLKKAQDPYIALFNYRTTPLQHGSSPSELLMSRKLRSRVTTFPSVHVPQKQDVEQFRKTDLQLRNQQKHYFDKRHRVRELVPLKEGQPVWIQTSQRSSCGAAPVTTLHPCQDCPGQPAAQPTSHSSEKQPAPTSPEGYSKSVIDTP